MAISDLDTLLKTLTVHSQHGVWAYGRGEAPVGAIFEFIEREAPCYIAPAEPTTPPDNRWVWLELAVYSDLNAVGFLAAVAQALADAGVPCNAIAAFDHDHIFVPEHLADTAIGAIEALAASRQ